MEKSRLENLKKDYSKIEKKHGLPSFDKLNQDFRIEKISETETDFLEREIRMIIGETFENFLRFLDALLNPVNAPMFMYPFLKAMSQDEKAKLMEIHKKLAKLEISSFKLINYSAKNEAAFIIEAFNLWQEIKKDFPKIVESMEMKLDMKKDNGKSYFG